MLLETCEPVIGLEVHVQLATRTKVFSPLGARSARRPTRSPIRSCSALPGTLPVLNRAALELALKLGVAHRLARSARSSRFARKHYFYPDLPKGYQISQYDEPLCEDGHVDLIARRAGAHACGSRASTSRRTRARTPTSARRLAWSISTAPACRSSRSSRSRAARAEEAAEFMRALHQLVRWLEISDGNMEEGRCAATPTSRCARAARPSSAPARAQEHQLVPLRRDAIEHEIARQIEIIERGGQRARRRPGCGTPTQGTSAPMRSKEEAHDYRYFPDPDLPPLASTAD